MFDMHYDLLTLLYVLKDNKDYQKELKKNLKKNLKGVTANLYFMSPKEMEAELNLKEPYKVVDMFIESKKILKKLKINRKILYSIEGCDYIKDSKELKKLKKQGLNSIILVWNNKNKYGSGNRSESGLTNQGKKLIQTAIDLNIGIDLSHANRKTFNDIIEVIKNYKAPALCYASHSNLYENQNNPRNLTNNQLQKLKEVNGKLGIVSYPPFITNEHSSEKIKQAYLKHIIDATKIMGVGNVMLSTDNMEFYHLINNEEVPPSPFSQKTIKKEIKRLLKKHFTKKDIKKIMYKNALEIYHQLKK